MEVGCRRHILLHTGILLGSTTFDFTGAERITKANRKCFSKKMVIYKCFFQNVTVFLQISPFHIRRQLTWPV
jgi:hypothetical protein